MTTKPRPTRDDAGAHVQSGGFLVPTALGEMVPCDLCGRGCHAAVLHLNTETGGTVGLCPDCTTAQLPEAVQALLDARRATPTTPGPWDQR